MADKKVKRVGFFERKALEKKEKALGRRLMAEQKKKDALLPKEAPEGVYVSLQNINKIYDNGFHAVHDFSIDIKQHEFIVFVGPSGCGKSTTLRMVAGLEDISGGNLFIDGEYMNDVAPKDRGIAMVFQSYALYPHMTVYNNMAYPLKIMHLSRAEIDRRVMHAAEILQIEDLLDRKPKALSGGQRQRVALGRAIVRHAKVLLMDEPLSNLDAKLRVQMRSEIVKLHNKLNATTIYVTHDQTEAMTMATRIVIMKRGYVQQIGTPIEIFNHPHNLFVAGFIGSPAMNFFEAEYDNGLLTLKDGHTLNLNEEQIKKHDEYYLASKDKNTIRAHELAVEIQAAKDELAKDSTLAADLAEINAKIETLSQQVNDPNVPDDQKIAIRAELNKAIEGRKKIGATVYEKEAELAKINQEIKSAENVIETHKHNIIVGLRPEDIHDAGTHTDALYEVTVSLAELLGNEYYIHANFGEKDMVARFPSAKQIQVGDIVKLHFDMEKLHLFSSLTELCIF